MAHSNSASPKWHAPKLAAFTIFCALFFGAITGKIILVPDGPIHEYDNHIIAAQQMAEERRVTLPHFLFQLLTIAHHEALQIFSVPTHQITSRNLPIAFDWGLAALIVMIEVYVGIALVLAYWFRQRLNMPGERRFDTPAYLIAFGLSIATPLFVLAPLDGKFYLGYLTPSTIYIIPTQVLLKLPSLGLFLLAPTFFTKGSENNRYTFLLPSLAIMSGLAKPNWLLVMLPALGLMSAARIVGGHYVNLRTLGLTIIASAAVLAWQFYFKFIDPSAPIYKSEIIITAPFQVWRHHSDYVFLKIVLSVAFPLYVILAFWRQARSDFHIRYAWLAFAIGLVYTGFLGESKAFSAGNFIWSGQIACFMLFVASASFFFPKFLSVSGNRELRFKIGCALFCAHVIFGLVYYLRSFTSPFI